MGLPVVIHAQIKDNLSDSVLICLGLFNRQQGLPLAKVETEI